MIAIFLIALAGLLSIRFLLGGDEDNWLCQNNQWVKHGQPSAEKPLEGCGKKTEPVIGGQKDEHGCLGPAGYSWCESKQICLRPWEETCQIVLENLKSNDTILSPLEISGQAPGAWFFEGSFPIELQDENGLAVANGFASAQGEWMTAGMVSFNSRIEFASTSIENGRIIFKKDNPSGLPENDLFESIPIQFASSINTSSVNVFFGNSVLDSDLMDCNNNFPVKRIFPKTEAVGKLALEALLAGPTESEKEGGYFSSINPQTKLQKLTIDKGIATAEFNEELEKGVSGSCRVSAIRSQIENTLKQFSSVKEVVISINGRTEDILQP